MLLIIGLILISVLIIGLILISGYIQQEPTDTSEAECQIPVDCEGRIHIQCVGYWQCIDSKCKWQCSGEHLELPEKEGEGMTG